MPFLKSLSRSLIVVTLLATAHVAQAREMVSVARTEINMREGASTKHTTLWALSRGFPLEVTGRKGNWLRVRDFENDTGWVYRPLVSKTPYHIVTTRIANIRSGPSTRNRIVGKAEHGEVLKTLERRSGWVKVQQDGGPQGWVSRKLLWGW